MLSLGHSKIAVYFQAIPKTIIIFCNYITFTSTGVITPRAVLKLMIVTMGTVMVSKTLWNIKEVQIKKQVLYECGFQITTPIQHDAAVESLARYTAVFYRLTKESARQVLDNYQRKKLRIKYSI